MMNKQKLEEDVKVILQCQKILRELHAEHGTRLAKACSDYLQYTLEDIEQLLGQDVYEHDTRKEFSIGQSVTLVDTVQVKTTSSICPPRTYKKGYTARVDAEGYLCDLKLDETKVKVRGLSPEGTAEYLYEYLIRDKYACYRSIDRALFIDRIAEGLYQLGFTPSKNQPDPPEVCYDDLDKHQFWQHVPDLIKLE